MKHQKSYDPEAQVRKMIKDLEQRKADLEKKQQEFETTAKMLDTYEKEHTELYELIADDHMHTTADNKLARVSRLVGKQLDRQSKMEEQRKRLSAYIEGIGSE